MADGYIWVRQFLGLLDNVIPLKGSKEQLEQSLIDYAGNVMFFTSESMTEDAMSKASAVDPKQLAHTEVEP